MPSSVEVSLWKAFRTGKPIESLKKLADPDGDGFFEPHTEGNVFGLKNRMAQM